LKNRYLYHSKIEEKKFRQILKPFALDLTASQSAEFINLNIKTINLLYRKFRERIKDLTNEISPIKSEYKTDESYFGPCRVRGKQSRGAIIFRLFKGNDKVYTKIVSDCKSATLSNTIRVMRNIGYINSNVFQKKSLNYILKKLNIDLITEDKIYIRF